MAVDGYGGLFNTYWRPENSCDNGSAAPPKAAWVAGAVTAAGAYPCTGATVTRAGNGSSLREYPAST